MDFTLGVYFLCRQWCFSSVYNTQEAACACSETEVIKYTVKRRPEVSICVCCRKMKKYFRYPRKVPEI